MPQPLTVWITINCGKFWKRWEYQTTWPASWETCMQVRKEQLELDMEQWTHYKLGKEYVKVVWYVKVVCCHPAYLTYMQSTSCKILDWMKQKLESRLPGEIPVTSDMQMTPPYGRKWKGTEEPIDKSERREWKCWLKTQHSKSEDHGIQSHHFMANRWGNNGNIYRLHFLGFKKSLQMVTAAMKLKDACSLEKKLWPT